MAGSTAITVATGVLLWNKEKDARCLAPNHEEDARVFEEYVDVSRRFRDVLKIFFTVAIIDVFRSVCMIIAVLRKVEVLATLYHALVINDILAFGGVFVLHAYRFSLSGRICVGDYKDDFTKTNLYKPEGTGYLENKGSYLLGLVCYVWVCGILGLIFNLSICLFNRRDTLKGVGSSLCQRFSTTLFYYRLKAGNQKDLLLAQYTYRVAHAIGLFVAVAAYLWY